MRASDRFEIEGITCLLNGRRCAVANVSVGGFFVVTEERPPVGQVLDLHVELGPGSRFTVQVKVTWLNAAREPSAPDLPVGFGVQISRIAFPDKLAILDLLRRSGGRPHPKRGG